MTNKTTIINVQDVHKSFKDVHAVRGLSFELAKGEFLALLGPNGAGKTTMVEMIEGIQKQDSGDIAINGMKWTAHNHNKLNRILGISLQETWFIEKLTVKETLSLFASFYKLDQQRVFEIIDLVRLDEKKNTYVKNLSGGQKQRLAIGISLINYPEILMLDEPTTGLDPTARREIWNILLELKRKKNISMILTTHYMEEAERLCDRIIIIDHGKILARGTLDELLDQCGVKELIEVAFDNHAEFDFGKLPGVFNIKKDESKISLEVERIVDTLPVLLKQSTEQNLKINTLECRKVTLDDLFISMTGRHLTGS